MHAALFSDLHKAISAGFGAPISAVQRDALADRLVRRQVAAMPAWAGLCRARGVDPAKVGWQQVPPVPTLAFKRFELWAGGGSEVVAEYRTSGTTGHTPGRVKFSDRSSALMAASIRANAVQHLLPDGRATRILVLAPRPSAAPHMIMAAGMSQLVHDFGLPGSRFLIGADGLDLAGLMTELGGSAAAGVPLTLIGASFGFVHLLDQLAAKDLRFALAPGSRLMHAGGFKGRSREVGPRALVAAFGDRFGLAPHRCVNLLGMTELASQMYEGVIAAGTELGRAKVSPPWTCTRVVHPATLSPLPDGQTGLLQHLDLANWDHPCLVQTDDLGKRIPGGFEVYGRARSDGSRGCSISVDEMLGP